MHVMGVLVGTVIAVVIVGCFKIDQQCTSALSSQMEGLGAEVGKRWKWSGEGKRLCGDGRT